VKWVKLIAQAEYEVQNNMRDILNIMQNGAEFLIKKLATM
jgi:hypothetical protein